MNRNALSVRYMLFDGISLARNRPDFNAVMKERTSLFPNPLIGQIRRLSVLAHIHFRSGCTQPDYC